MGCKNCVCSDRPKGNIYYEIWFVVSKMITAAVALYIFINMQFEVDKAETFFTSLYYNHFIEDIIEEADSGGCLYEYQPVVLGNWTGVTEGCYCDDGTFPGDCSKDGCIQVQQKESKPFMKWGDKGLCVKYNKEIYNSYLGTGPGSECVKEGYRQCGILDKYGNKLCLSSEFDCPINYLTITSTPDPQGDYYNGKTIKLSNTKYLHVSNRNENGFLIYSLKVSEETICVRSDEKYYYVNNFEKYPLETNYKCDEYDNNYIKVDSMLKSSFFTQNEIELNAIPGYPVDDTKPQFVSLYTQVFPGYNTKCFGRRIKESEFYYEDDIMFIIRLSFMIFAVISAFFSIFTIDTFINRLGCCYVGYIGFIFVFDIGFMALSLMGIVLSIQDYMNPICASSYLAEILYKEFHPIHLEIVLYVVCFFLTFVSFLSFFCWCGDCCGSEILDEFDVIETKADVDVHTLQVTCLCAMKGGKIVSGSKDKSLILCTVDLYKKTWEFQFEEKDAHDNEITALCSLNDIRFVSCSLDMKVIVWDIGNQGLLKTITYIGHKAQVLTVIALNKKEFISGSTDCNVIEWNCSDNNYRDCIQEEGQVVSLLYLQKTKKLVTQIVNFPRVDYCQTILNFWDYSKKQKLNSLERGNTINQGMLELENDLIAVSECLTNSITIINTNNYAIVKNITNNLIQTNSALCYFDKESFLTAANGNICRISVKDNYNIVYFGKFEKEFWGQAFIALRVEDYPYGRRFVAGSNNSNGYYVGEFVREDDK